MINDKKNFCEELKKFFRERGISQYDLAARFNTAQSYIGALLNGRKAFGKKTAQQWADAFGLSVSWLLTGEGSMLAGDNSENQNGCSECFHDADYNQNGCGETPLLSKALDEISEMRKTLSEAIRANQDALRVNQEHTTALITILQNMTK